MNPVYLTTPLYYVNDTPHIGHAYTTCIVDVLNRFHRLFGRDSLFLTGTDEHGLKVQQAAEKRNLPPQQHCDEMVLNFQNIWKEMDIQYDIFYRTTDPTHHQVVQSCLQQLHTQGDIYEKDYEGWYSLSEEVFYTEDELIDGKTPQGNEVKKVSEKNYFFRMSTYQKQLIEHIDNNPTFIQPTSKKNEVLGFLKKPLQDLCISRPKTRLHWGIEIPFNSNFVTYVWFDALLNYAAAVGFTQESKDSEFKKWWPHATHIIGKDILTTHSVYWTTILMALGCALPKTIFAHGWWLTDENEKMSKSKGKVIRPLDLKDIVGIEALRYFLVRDIRFGNDAQFSTDLVINRVNTDLANNLGNLLNRSTKLVEKYFDGKTPAFSKHDLSSQNLMSATQELGKKIQFHIDALQPSLAIEHIINLLIQANQYIDEKAPWKQAKEDLEACGHSLRVVMEVLQSSAILLSPVMPQKMKSLLDRLGFDQKISFENSKTWPALTDGKNLGEGSVLFPRIDMNS